MSTKPAIRPSASLIVAAPMPKEEVRDGTNYRILMMKRNAKSSFINAHVYPGGIVDKADHYSNWIDGKLANEKEGYMLTNKICAIRETFEESGLLLTTPPSNTIKELNVNKWKHKVHQDASQFKVMCDKYQVRPAVNALIPFTNWITPVMEKKRYNTVFFLTILEEFKTKKKQDLHLSMVAADGKETVMFDWFQPEEALQKHKNKEIVMIPPQWYSLSMFAEVADYKDLKEKAGIDVFRTKTNELIRILPQANPCQDKGDYKMFLAYPGDEAYVSNEYKSKKGDRHRLYVKGRLEEFSIERNINVADIFHNTSSL